VGIVYECVGWVLWSGVRILCTVLCTVGRMCSDNKTVQTLRKNKHGDIWYGVPCYWNSDGMCSNNRTT